MNELARPFLRTWQYVGDVGGYPGQIFFVLSVIMLAIVIFTWVGNRR